MRTAARLTLPRRPRPSQPQHTQITLTTHPDRSRGFSLYIDALLKGDASPGDVRAGANATDAPLQARARARLFVRRWLLSCTKYVLLLLSVSFAVLGSCRTCLPRPLPNPLADPRRRSHRAGWRADHPVRPLRPQPGALLQRLAVQPGAVRRAAGRRCHTVAVRFVRTAGDGAPRRLPARPQARRAPREARLSAPSSSPSSPLCMLARRPPPPASTSSHRPLSSPGYVNQKTRATTGAPSAAPAARCRSIGTTAPSLTACTGAASPPARPPTAGPGRPARRSPVRALRAFFSVIQPLCPGGQCAHATRSSQPPALRRRRLLRPPNQRRRRQ